MQQHRPRRRRRRIVGVGAAAAWRIINLSAKHTHTDVAFASSTLLLHQTKPFFIDPSFALSFFCDV
jgi:hypothetical protein